MSAGPTPVDAGPPAADPRPADLGRLALMGSLWTLGGHGLSQLLRLAGHVLLARLLFPEAFGLMALAAVLLQGLQMFADLGITAHIVQSERAEDRTFLDTAWTVQVLRGLGVWLVSLLLAWPVARLYDEPRLLLLLPVLGLTAVIGGFNSTGLSVLQRRLELRKLILIDFGAQLCGVVCMLAWALWRPSVWALVLGGLAQSASHVLLSHMLTDGPRNRLAWDRASAASLIQFGRYVLLATAFAFLANRGDRLIAASFLSFASFGLYWIGAELAFAAVRFVERLSGRVLLPLYARLKQAHPAEYRRRIAATRLKLLGVVAPVLLGLGLGGQILVDLVYDARYAGAGWYLRMLASGAIVATAAQSLRPLLLAAGDPRRHMLCRAADSALLLAALAAGGLIAGRRGLVTAAALAPLLSYPFLLLSARRHGVWTPLLELGVAGLSILLLAYNLSAA